MVKQCKKCSKIKPFADFYPRSKDRNHKYVNSKAGYSNECRPCTYESRKENKLNNPDKVKNIDTNSRLKRVYGIDLNQYNQMLIDQNYRCLGCEKHQDELTFKLAVDHCHASGSIRGLLCINCNSVLGQARDNIKVLTNLIDYLTTYTGLAATSSIPDVKSDKESRVTL